MGWQTRRFDIIEKIVFEHPDFELAFSI